MNKKGFAWNTKTTTLVLLIAIGVVALSTLSVLTYTYITISNKVTPSNGVTSQGTGGNNSNAPNTGSSATHLACVNNACILVNGAGANTCTNPGGVCGTSSGGSSGGSGGSSTSVSGQLSIVTPAQGQTFGYDTLLLLNYTISNATASVCWYNIDSGASKTLSNCNMTYFNTTSGSHTIRVFANVSGGTLSDSHSFNVALNAPTISIISPSNSSYVNLKNVSFTYLPSDNPSSDLSSCELWGDFNGTYSKNQTNSSAVSDVNNIFTIPNLADRAYVWAISCIDKENNRAVTSNMTFTIDTVYPLISITQPQGLINSTTLVQLNFSVQDVNPISCSYNVTSIAGTLIISRSLTNCANTTFAVADGNYTLALHAQAAGMISTATTNFTVNTAGIATLLSFLPPTPSNASTVNATSFVVNVSAIDSLSRYVALDLDNSLVSWVRMDDSAVNGNVLDISSYANTIDMAGAKQVVGRWGSAIYIANSSDGFSIHNSAAVNISSSFTVSIWFKGNSSNNNQFIIGKWDGVTSNELSWELTLAVGGVCNGIDFYISQDGGSLDRVYARKCNQTYQDGLWHHAVGVFDSGKNITLYIDKDATNLTIVGNISSLLSVHSNNNPVYVGSHSSGYYNGSLDEILLFNRALNAQEVGALYGAGNSPYYKNFTGLVDGAHTFKAFSVNSVGVQNQTEKRIVSIIGGCGGLGCSPPINNVGSSRILNLIIVIHGLVLGVLIASFVYMRRKEKREQAYVRYAQHSQMLNSGRKDLR